MVHILDDEMYMARTAEINDSFLPIHILDWSACLSPLLPLSASAEFLTESYNRQAFYTVALNHPSIRWHSTDGLWYNLHHLQTAGPLLAGNGSNCIAVGKIKKVLCWRCRIFEITPRGNRESSDGLFTKCGF